jgi:hypothetical protein
MQKKTGLPVRSAVLKPCAGCLVVGRVTTSEYRLLIVFGWCIWFLWFLSIPDLRPQQLVSGAIEFAVRQANLMYIPAG